jgi:hypothetical protein
MVFISGLLGELDYGAMFLGSSELLGAWQL